MEALSSIKFYSYILPHSKVFSTIIAISIACESMVHSYRTVLSLSSSITAFECLPRIDSSPTWWSYSVGSPLIEEEKAYFSLNVFMKKYCHRNGDFPIVNIALKTHLFGVNVTATVLKALYREHPIF